MMSYSSKEGSFPFTYDELDYIGNLCSERISDMKNDLEKKDPQKFLFIKSLSAKVEGLIELMDARKDEESKRMETANQIIKSAKLN